LSLIFPPTIYRGHILPPLLLGNERIIWSVAHVNASWNRSKRALSTRVCLTQHPSDTLRLFRELNCPTSYICSYPDVEVTNELNYLLYTSEDSCQIIHYLLYLRAILQFYQCALFSHF